MMHRIEDEPEPSASDLARWRAAREDEPDESETEHERVLAEAERTRRLLRYP